MQLTPQKPSNEQTNERAVCHRRLPPSTIRRSVRATAREIRTEAEPEASPLPRRDSDGRKAKAPRICCGPRPSRSSRKQLLSWPQSAAPSVPCPPVDASASVCCYSEQNSQWRAMCEAIGSMLCLGAAPGSVSKRCLNTLQRHRDMRRCVERIRDSTDSRTVRVSMGSSTTASAS